MRPKAAACSVLVCAAFALADPPAATSPASSQPATRPATRAAVEVSPEAAALLGKLNAAYASPRAESFRVNVRGEFDVAGRARTYTLDAIGYADGKGRFDHDVKGVGRVVQTDDRVIVYDARRNAYGTIDQPPRIRPAREVAEALSDVFIDENPALLMLITTEPAELLKRGATSIAARDGALVVTSATDIRTIRINGEGVIQSMTIDYTPLLKARGASPIRSAIATLTYAPADDLPPPKEAFVFDVPSGAVEFRIGSELMQSGASEGAGDKPPPDHIRRLIEQLKPDAESGGKSD